MHWIRAAAGSLYTMQLRWSFSSMPLMCWRGRMTQGSRHACAAQCVSLDVRPRVDESYYYGMAAGGLNGLGWCAESVHVMILLYMLSRIHTAVDF